MEFEPKIVEILGKDAYIALRRCFSFHGMRDAMEIRQMDRAIAEYEYIRDLCRRYNSSEKVGWIALDLAVGIKLTGGMDAEEFDYFQRNINLFIRSE